VDSGRRISDVAALTLEELEGLAQEDRREAAPRSVRTRGLRRSGSVDPESFLAEGLEAVENLEGDRLRQILTEASVSLTPLALRREVLVPLMRETGRRWREGSFRIANEHLATAIVRSFLGALALQPSANGPRPRVILTTPVGNDHELGALMASASAADVGWDPLFLGPNLPAEEIAAAAHTKGARAVAISLTYPHDDAAIHEELRKMRRLLDEDIQLVVGGDAAPDYEETLRETGALLVDDLGEFQAALESLGSSRGPGVGR
jgi:methylmalonyl-CoA mutase cobalamin-binding subunit